MADGTDREATKLRLLAMAADYEARAGLTNDLIDSDSVLADGDTLAPKPDEEVTMLAEPSPGTLTLKPVRKVATGSKETVQRRPVGRPRRE